MKEQWCMTSGGKPQTMGSKQQPIRLSDINSYKESDG